MPSPAADAPGGAHKALFSFGYRRSPDQDSKSAVRHEVVVVGAGPVGLCAAIDLRLHGVPVVVLDDADRIGEGSRAICFSKRTLEILDRLGVGEEAVARGVTWKTGKVFRGDELVFAFDLLPETGHKMPAFINLQQYYLEHCLVARAAACGVDIRWRNRVTGIERGADGAGLTIETPEGEYALEAGWVVAADGARSTLRRLLGLDWRGEVFEDRFLIADVRMHANFPVERRFWFDPPFHAGQSALLHKQPDDVWRIDLQLGFDADPEVEQQPQNVVSRVRQMLGHEEFSLEWVSVYTFQCRRIDHFAHGHVLFAGDAAHQVSPFGARGANSGIQDAENLAWKLALVIAGGAPSRLMETYDLERSAAADENIRHSTRSTDFIAPRTPVERRLRNAVLHLAGRAEFARRMVNSGRLSLPAAYETPLSTPDRETWGGSARLGAPVPDAPVDAGGQPTHLLAALPGSFVLLVFAAEPPATLPAGLKSVVIGRDIYDLEGKFAERFDATPGACWLLRPDHHLAARWRRIDPQEIEAALCRAKGMDL